MIRRIDDLGRAVLPKKIRRTLDLVPNTSVEMFVHDGNVHVRKQERTCFVIGNISENHMEFYDGHLILSREGAKNLMKTLERWVLE
ncbi:AbrB/MazE/SpoVT family DNA-binding domain-containing protein [Bacillus sp. CDB3]|uniref:AbrB/MazE/SpoVT family DNA-binding domain-containing protein n=1 Tax=Bacillus sp. CDB3 TaxID=360310 RepID=UPI0009D8BBF5|nr:AbrB/MazE/SpoVT family DNA-binding domain-containing protein [Bacillus sp. CDB3]OQR53313.1 AbrB family transcriptional regulator [Bacillus sp. CDB3]